MAATALAALLAAGCANRCDKGQALCQYGCRRDYQVCQLHGNEEFYCRNQIGNCWTRCDASHAACKPHWWSW